MQNEIAKIRELHKINSTHQPKYWWDHNTAELYNNVQIMRKKFQQISNIENLINLNKSKAKLQRQKSINKAKYIEKLFEDTDPHTSSSVLWNRVGVSLNKKKNFDDQHIILNDMELARSFMVKTCGKTNVEELVPISESNQESSELINVELFDKIIYKNKSTASGYDDITYEHLRNLNLNVKTNIIQNMNEIWLTNKIPEEFKEIKIIAIRKKK